MLQTESVTSLHVHLSTILMKFTLSSVCLCTGIYDPEYSNATFLENAIPTDYSDVDVFTSSAVKSRHVYLYSTLEQHLVFYDLLIDGCTVVECIDFIT